MEFTFFEIVFLCFSPLIAIIGVGVCEDLVKGRK